MNKFNRLTEIQKIKFREMSGYEYDNKSLSGRFETDRPYDQDDWKYSPWLFSFTYDQDSGNLFCQLDHRMTNNRTSGWDSEGNKIDNLVVEKIYPSHP